MKHALEYAAVRALRGVVRLLPRHARGALGGALGRLVWAFDARHRQTARTNLARAFPNRTPREVDAIVRQVFAHFGRLLVHLLEFSAFTPDEVAARVEFEGEDYARHAYAQGRGVLFFTGHFGFWEIHALGHGLQLGPLGVLARPLDNPRLNAMLEDVRGLTGNAVIYRQGAVRRVLKRLSDGLGVAILIDQHMHSPDAITVSFFGRPAQTTSTLAAIALRTGSPVVPCFALPLPGGRFRLVYEPPVEPPAADSPDAVREFTQRCTDVLEMYVRRHPELWLWMHRRWRE
ncbi:MAG: lysophospholipid acyltransferase family protein [Acidobacteriota bacterium]